MIGLKTSLFIVSTIHLIFLYIICNGLPITLMNIVWQMQGFRALPL